MSDLPSNTARLEQRDRDTLPGGVTGGTTLCRTVEPLDGRHGVAADVKGGLSITISCLSGTAAVGFAERGVVTVASTTLRRLRRGTRLGVVGGTGTGEALTEQHDIDDLWA